MSIARRITLTAAAACTALLCACGDTSNVDRIINKETTVNVGRSQASVTTKAEESKAEETAKAETTTKQTEADKDTAETADTSSVTQAEVSDWRDIDDVQLDVSDQEVIDLTQMDSTMIYATVFNMVNYPEDYFGKRIIMDGTLAVMPSDIDEDLNYYFVVIADAAACCSQGVEFIWDDNTHSYPQDYPADGSDVVVSGIYGEYEEMGLPYYYVAADSLEAK
mgnify:CR=1 FL=1